MSSFIKIISRKCCVWSADSCRADTDHMAAVVLASLIRRVFFIEFPSRSYGSVCVNELFNSMPSFHDATISQKKFSKSELFFIQKEEEEEIFFTNLNESEFFPEFSLLLRNTFGRDYCS